MISESKKFDANIETVPDMMAYVDGLITGFSEKIAYDIKLACEEILVNIASYAYPDGNGKLSILWEDDTEKNTLRITFEDSGIPFNPLQKDEPELGVPIAERKIGGLGISMVRKIMDSVQYSNTDGNNILTVTKAY